MKKSLLALSAAAIALSGMAATPKQQLQVSPLQIEKNKEIQGLRNLRVGHAPAAMMKAPAKINSAADVITEAEGTRQNMTITGSGYYLFWGIMLADYYDQTVGSHIIYGENNEVYLYDILPNASTGAYVKGVKDGDKITVDLPQTVLWDDEAGDGFNLNMMQYYEFEEDGEVYGDYAVMEEDNTLVFTIDENGGMTAEIADGQLLGLAYASDNMWAGYGAFALSMVEFNDVLVTLPEDYEAAENFWTCISDGYGWPVTWAQGADEVYFQGLGNSLPEAWVKGSMEIVDDTTAIISIAQDQYIGDYAGHYIYTKAAKITYDESGEVDTFDLMPDDYVYELVWDFESMTITPKDPEISLLYNAAKDHVYYLQILTGFKLTVQDGPAAGTPANPYDLSFADTLDAYGYSGFFFTVPCLNTEGELLDSEALYYVVYVDGDEWTFEPEEYGTEEAIEEVPWNTSLYYIYHMGGAKREVDLFVEGITTLGVQSVYKYNDEETRSEIVTLDLDTPNAVQAIGDKKVASVKYFGLDGREVANPAEGIFVKRVTFEDGTVATFKKVVR